MLGVGDLQRLHRHKVLATYSEHSSTCDEHARPGAGGQNVRQEGRRIHHLFEVIQDEKGFPSHQVCLQDINRRVAPGIAEPERLRDGQGNEVEITDGSKRDEAHAVRKIGSQSVRYRHREARFAHAAGPRKGQQANVAVTQQRACMLYFPRASDQGS
jgi:hypothetical protein